MMMRDKHHWALVLAAGDGTRLHALTRDDWGQAVPKQFCSLQGGPTLLQETVARACRIVPSRRVTAVVQAAHRRWWSPQLAEVAAHNRFVQPANRGTALGVLMPLLHILERDPDARVVVLPSDHFIADEAVLDKAMRDALALSDGDASVVTLLGVRPEVPDPELGYVVPGRRARGGSFHVARFIEKPEALVARNLIALGAVWNTFIIVGGTAALTEMITSHLPDGGAALRSTLASAAWAVEPGPALAALYQQLPAYDLSRDVLAGAASRLRVLPVNRCGWSDLGNPQRLADCLRRAPRNAKELAPVADSYRALINLAEAHARLQPAV